MDPELTGRVAIVAAASKGLGREGRTCPEGANIAICARTASALAETASQIQKATGREAFYKALNVTDSKAVTDFTAAVETHFGRLHIFGPNSAGPPPTLVTHTPPA